MFGLLIRRIPRAAAPALARRTFATTNITTPPAAPSTISGVAAVLKRSSNSPPPSPTIFNEFALKDRVALVTGANRGLGLEMALALCEQGAKVYAFDLPDIPSADFVAVSQYVDEMGEGRALNYVSANVTDQPQMWEKVEKVADKEGRLDVCIAAAGILGGSPSLEYTAKDFEKIIDVNCNGVFYTAQAAGRQMTKFGTPGSIILIASMSGSVTNRDNSWVAYNTSKSAVLQMGRSLSCELGPARIRVNTLSPGYIYTKMTADFLDNDPTVGKEWAAGNPLNRLGAPEELRGVVAWLASDASSYCTGSDILVSGGHTVW